MMGTEQQGLVKPKVAPAGMAQQRCEGWERSTETPSDAIVKPPKPQFRGVAQELGAARSDVVVMPKLVIGAPGDAYEQEADQVAKQVVQRLHAPDGGRSQSDPSVQRKILPSATDDFQRAPIGRGGEAIGGREALPDMASAITSARGRGQPLATELQQAMGQAMGADFRGVRVHTDAQSDQLNQDIQAKAFTTGQDVFFRSGAYQPNSRSGQALIAHELTHIVQQNGAQSEVVQRAGDKIAFEKVQSDNAEIALIQKSIQEAIAEHQVKKRTYKDKIETKKDQAIAAVKPVDTTDLSEEDLDKAREIERVPKREALHEFVEEYEQSGWHLDALQEEILGKTNKAVYFGNKVADEIPIMTIKGNKKIYSIFFGAKRFVASINSGSDVPKNPIFIKKGADKEYVQDARQTFIPRFASRGCSIQQLRQILSIGKLGPRNSSDEIGKEQHKRYDFGNRKPDATMSQREKEFVQLRDGSGPDQRFLSITHAKATRKIFGNHGDVFTSEAVVKLDLAQIPPNLIFNQHLEVSRQGLVSLANQERKTTVEKEKKEAIYSVIKNRETLLSEIPRTAIVAVAEGTGPWMSLHEARLKYDTAYRLAEEEKQEKEQTEKKQAEAKKAKKQENAKQRATTAILKQEKSLAEEKIAKEHHAKVLEKLNSMKTKDKKKLEITSAVEDAIKKDADNAYYIQGALREGRIKESDDVKDILQVLVNDVAEYLKL
jgi:Domain of unknown function (DUF4157)